MGISGWLRQYPPTANDLTCAFFVNPLQGWVAGDRGTILHTSDGGEHWVEQPGSVRGTINDLFFLDGKTGWALVGGTLGAHGRDLREEQILMKTDNGGQTWRVLAEMDALSLYFVNAHVGYAAGNYGTVLKTENGGKTWGRCVSLERAIGTPIKLPGLIFAFTQLHFFDARQGWALGNYYGEGITKPGGVFFTMDGGQTWEKRLGLNPAERGEIVQGRFTSLQHGCITAEIYRGDARYITVFQTTDGGENWVERKSAIPGFHITTFTNPMVGWTAGPMPLSLTGPPLEVGIWRTGDGGQTWSEETALAGLKLYDVFFLDATKGWAVGESGIILRYTR
jgi:photosystem II stability/assembly factor-like uncharacterized protein